MTNPEPPATCLCSSGERGCGGPKKKQKGSPSPKGDILPPPLTISVEVIETTEGSAPCAMSANDGIVSVGPAGAAGTASRFVAARRGDISSVPVRTAPATTAAAMTASNPIGRIL